jgi:hypothetical protein
MPSLTSSDSPLRIAAVHAGRAPSLIGITFCPGKKQRGGLTASWDRSLDVDLDAIAAWGAKAVLTLVTRDELIDLAVPELGQGVTARGMQWFHLPIPDYSIPDAEWEARWQEEGAALRAMLMRGDRVLVHCRGGLGRSGVVAARLLIELGLRPHDAIEQVRKVRPGAIETGKQEAYVRALGNS